MKHSILAIFILIISVGFLACGNDSEPIELPVGQAALEESNPDPYLTITAEQFAIGEMELGYLSTTAFSHTVRANGFIDVPPKSKAAISVYYGGYVKGLDLLPGQRVRKGQVLFSLENPDFVQMQQDYLEAKAQLGYLKADFERQQTLASENIASQKNYLKAESDYQVQLARSEGLKKKLEMLGLDLGRVEARDFVSQTKVYAPISGFITQINANSGSFLNTSDVAVEITSTDHLHLELDVFEKDIHWLKEGQRIQFRKPGSMSAEYTASVHLIGSMVEGESRIIRVHGHLEDESKQTGLIPGMYVEAEIETTVDSVLALPETAVISLEEDAYILVQHSKSGDIYQFERKMVEVGRTINGMTEIKGNQLSREPILVKGAFNLINE